MSLELVGFIKRSKNRQKVFLAVEGSTLPSEIVRKLYGKWSSSRYVIVSRALAELTAKGLLKVANPQEKVGRVYVRTALGNRIALMITG